MGLNISIVKMPELMRDIRFDFIRHFGDDKFWTTDEIEWVACQDEDDMRRPVDFAAARLWVNNNIFPSGNAKRLIDGINILEQDETLWMRGSW